MNVLSQETSKRNFQRQEWGI